MNIRTRKSNHRSKVSLFNTLDEKAQPIGYFTPLLKEKKTSIRVNALKNLHHIFTFQERDNDVEMLDEKLLEVLCGLIPTAEKQELELSSSVIGLAALHIGPNQHIFKLIKGLLSTILTDGEEHRNVDTICSATYALSLSCFFCCSDPESYSHTINMIKDLLESSKKKLVLHSALSAFMLLASKLDSSKIVNYQDILTKLTDFSRSSFPDLRLNSAIAIAFIVDETKYQVQDEKDEDDDEEEEEDYYEDEEEEEEYNYNNNNKKQVEEEEEEEESNEGSAGDDDDEDYDDEEEEEEEVEIDDHIIQVIQDIFKVENEKGKKKIVTRNTLRQIVNTLETGSTPVEIITIDGQQFLFKGWRKYIQLQAIRKLVGPGLTNQWLFSENLQDILQVEIHTKERTKSQTKAFKNALPVLSKKRTQDLNRDRRNSSQLYEHNGDQ
ncbi:hypothetical protein DLAC_01246 [Tieghemostelium lacteum]|uniref:Interferon-related developmental regulator N-terminal domain-containing protein n=1 Tax=Tieghemostelium lacteum TaxID=361077 RepID=A0A152A8L9_TIELA|nr:hypothetical protein DLAC_01246 [Tieghemostelium lacteum]|eukprot:KYR02407.1 hypothetical protein DLAC_01246 [Tieghemostelium lacteum]